MLVGEISDSILSEFGWEDVVKLAKGLFDFIEVDRVSLVFLHDDVVKYIFIKE